MSAKLIGILILLVAQSAFAATIPIKIEPDDNPLSIKALPRNGMLEGRIRALYTGSESSGSKLPIIFLSSHLKHANNDETIDRANVSVSPKEIIAGQYNEFTVAIRNIKRPGQYTGSLKFHLADHLNDDPIVVALNIEALSPNLTPVQPFHKIDGKLKDWYVLEFQKPEQTAVQIQSLTTAAKGKYGNVLPFETFVHSNCTKCPANSSTYFLKVDLKNRNGIAPDHYEGNLRIFTRDAVDAAQVPIDLNVRVPFLWLPFLILLFSIVIGRLAKYMNDKGNRKSALYSATTLLEIRAEQLQESDREIMEQFIQQLRRNIHASNFAIVDTELPLVQRRIDILIELRRIENLLAAQHPPHQNAQLIESEIAKTRISIQLSKDEDAAKSVERIHELLLTSPADVLPQVASAGMRIKQLSERKDVQKAQVESKIRRLLSFLIGVQPGGTVEEIFLLSVRALLWLVLLAGLIFMGVQQIFDKNPTFGAELFDYVGLFLWGIGSDVASKTLVSLSISKPS